MAYVVGILLACGVSVLARVVGFDRDRAFYPTVLMVVASYYVLFAVMAPAVHPVLMESAVMTAFVVAAIAGFSLNPWITVSGLVTHGLFDAVHGALLENAGVPIWWPAFCLAYDVGAAACLAWLLTRSQPGGSSLDGRDGRMKLVHPAEQRPR
jgi:hypothetical protein